jgi:hypothetical protein
MANIAKSVCFLSMCLSVFLASNVYEADAAKSFFDESEPSRVAYRQANQTKLVNVGRAPFALASPKFNCKGFVSSIKELDFLHIAWLYNTFGNDYRCLNEILSDPRLITLQTNLINEPGHRNRRLEKHEFLYGISSPKKYDRLLKSRNPDLKRKFEKYVSPLQDILASRLQPYTECLINPGLESNVSTRAAKVLVEWTKEAFPYCKIIWNPIAKVGSPAGTGAELVEQHGWNPKFQTHACTFNNDGSDINFPEREAASAALAKRNPNTIKDYLNSGAPLQGAIEEFANQCKVIYLWTAEDNCFNHDNLLAPWLPPLKRGCKNGPVNRLVAKEVRRAHRLGVRAPKQFVYTAKEESSFLGCSEIKNPNDGFKKGFLLKQSEFSDRGGVIITPSKFNSASQITLVHEGKVIDRYKRSGNYSHDGSNRGLWRSQTSPLAYPLKVAVKIKQGSRTICYRVNNPRIRND